MRDKYEYEVERRGSGRAPTCFPAGYDRSDLVEITTVTDSWAVFISARDGTVVRCEDYAKQAERLAK